MEPMNDKMIVTLIKDAQRGKEAFELLVKRYQHDVFRIIRVYTKNDSDAEDLAQETWMKVYRSIGKLKEPYHLESWLKTIAVNTTKDWLSSRAHRKSQATDEFQPEQLSDSAVLQHQQQQLIGEIRDAIDSLSAKNREVVYDFYICGYSAAEISQRLKVPVSTVTGRLQEARKKLREEFESMVAVSGIQKMFAPDNFVQSVMERVGRLPMPVPKGNIIERIGNVLRQNFVPTIALATLIAFAMIGVIYISLQPGGDGGTPDGRMAAVPTLALAPGQLDLPTFTDVTVEAGVGNIFHGQFTVPTVVWGDYDNDGNLDLYVTQTGNAMEDVFCRNNGDGTFTDVTNGAGLGKNTGSSLAGFLDYDNDGYTDLYTRHHINNESHILFYHNNGNGTFTDITEDTGIKVLPGVTYGGGFGDYNNDGFLDMYFTRLWRPNVFYQNNGDGTFTDVTNRAGLGLGGAGGSWNFTSGDYDNDGDLDIYLPGGTGDKAGPASLCGNNGDGTFTDMAKKAGVNDNRDGRCSAFFDYDNDGDLDLYTLSATGSTNRLYRNNGDGTFTDVAWEAGVFIPSNSERLTVGDYDNDGYMDIFVMPWNGARILYHNNGDGTFTDVAVEAGVNAQMGAAGGCAFADYDNDGDIDLYVANRNGLDALYRNEGNDNHWLHIKPIGTKSNRDGVGARVMVRAGELSMMREINPGCNRGHNVLTAHFGLGQNAKADDVEIRWPSGQVDVYKNIDANQRITVKEGEGWRRGFVSEWAVNPIDKVPTTLGKIRRFALLQNFPNPFNPETWIPFQLSKASEVRMRIYAQSGQLVRTLSLGHKEAGTYLEKSHAGYWDGRNEAGEPVASGIYFYQLEAGGFSQNRRMTVLK